MDTEQQKNLQYTRSWKIKYTVLTHGVEAVVDEMLQIFAHPDLSHQLVLVAVHSGQLTDMSKDVLQPISQLQYRESSGITGLKTFEKVCVYK